MVKETIMEKIFKFPLPDYIQVFDNQKDLNIQPYCICYQYDINEKQIGPYGFETKMAVELIKNIFGVVKYWNHIELKEIDNPIIKDNRGIYFYDSFEKVENEYLKVNDYLIKKKKNDFLVKKNREIIPLPKYPLLLDLLDGKLFKTDPINHLMNKGISLFIQQFYMPEAGHSLILFDENLIEKIKYYAKENKIDFFEVNSINDLTPW